MRASRISIHTLTVALLAIATAVTISRPFSISAWSGIVGASVILLSWSVKTGRTSLKGLTKVIVRARTMVHIIVGTVGLGTLLWHTGFNFHGFAGWATIILGAVVVSGLSIRYLSRVSFTIPFGYDEALDRAQHQLHVFLEDARIALIPLHLPAFAISTDESSVLLYMHEATYTSPVRVITGGTPSASSGPWLFVLGRSKVFNKITRTAHKWAIALAMAGISIHVISMLYFGGGAN